MFYVSFADELMKLGQATSAGPRAEMSPGLARPPVGPPVKGLAAARKLTRPFSDPAAKKVGTKNLAQRYAKMKMTARGENVGPFAAHKVYPGGRPKKPASPVAPKPAMSVAQSAGSNPYSTVKNLTGKPRVSKPVAVK